jgi:putative membrane-bound dehydrogenase-like protein
MLQTCRFLLLTGLLALVVPPPLTAAEPARPNILLILSDDMGFSDLGCYGGEIHTPNLDRLAARGVRFTQCYNTARCCPTRAALLTGLYSHQTGVGHMMEDKGYPAYRGDLNGRCVTIAEVLKPAGYRTYAVGKWHVTRHLQPNSSRDNWPLQRGFDRYYGTLTGAGSYFDPGTLTRDNTPVSPFADPEYQPARFYYTDAISDQASRFIREHQRDHAGRPFFLYAAFTAAHWPMQAKAEDIARYKGTYDAGYDAVRQARFQRLQKLGLINPRWRMPATVGDWHRVKDKGWEARCMEVYAAMIDCLDQGVGRIVEALEQTGQRDNTLILFLQDNGGCAETIGRTEKMTRPDKPTLPPIPADAIRSDVRPKQTRAGMPMLAGPGVLPGPEDTFIAYGEAWANVSNTPFRLYKHWEHEGGIATPLIANWPQGIPAARHNQLEKQPVHLIDLLATCVDLAGARYPAERQGQKVQPMEGVSLRPAFAGEPLRRGRPLFWEHEGNRAVRDGKWKLVSRHPGPWELYDMEEDRTELHDLAAEQPMRVKEMTASWQAWAERVGVKPWPIKAPAKSAQEERTTFRVANGFRLELVACEPQVIDPVAMAFDEDGRLFVAEMHGYNSPTPLAEETSGKIKLLEDRDDDGLYEHATTFAQGLRLPTGLMAWKGGILATVAPDLIFFKDRDGDGRADLSSTLYTGFSLGPAGSSGSAQGFLNAPQWALDNWVYVNASHYGGKVRSTEKPGQPAVELLGRRGVRFHPEKPGSLEPTSGGGQYGLAADDWQRWFVNSNSVHLMHIVLPDHYLRRNPRLHVEGVTVSIADGKDGHDAACKLYRISPFEAWRVERSRRNLTGSWRDWTPDKDKRKGPAVSRHPASEQVGGGYVTSGCSPVVYTADLFPPAYRGNTFMCDPANNLVHRDVLEAKGSSFVAHRGEAEEEFLASTDTWFRPVHLSVGPDGALYVLDFYRPVIEDYPDIPEDLRQGVNPLSSGRGRIWRIVPEGANPTRQKPLLSKASAAELVQHLDDANAWWRLTAQRLLVERQDKSVVRLLGQRAREASSPVGRAHALWTLQGLGALDGAVIEHALKDPSADVREQALRLAETYLAGNASLRAAVAALADDPAPRVRFQLAFTLGEVEGSEALDALARIARRDAADPGTRMAILSSSSRTAAALLDKLVHSPGFGAAEADRQLVTRLAAQVGAGSSDAELAEVLRLVAMPTKGDWQVAVLAGLGQGAQNSRRALSRLWESPPASLRRAIEDVRPLFVQAAASARDARRPPAERTAAIRLLGYGPFATAAPVLQGLLEPQNPAEMQLAAVRALAAQQHPKVPDILLASWNSFTPTLRREVLEALFARVDRLQALLTAIEQKKLPASQLEPSRIEQLLKHPNAPLRQRAQTLFTSATPDRTKIVEAYQAALALKPDGTRGKMVFQKNCATCHRLDNQGVEVGPDLVAALRNKTPERLLVDILDPSREVDARYLNYVVTTKNGRTLSGMIGTEAATSLTLRRAEKAEETVLRSDIEEIQGTAKSVMPEGLEAQLSKQDVADLIAYLLSQGEPPPADAQQGSRGQPAGSWKAGVAKVTITPEKPMWMSGYGNRTKRAEGVEHDLWAKALVLEDPAGQQAVLVTLDLVGIDRPTSHEVCRMLEKQYGLGRARIALNCSHTHCGPVVGRNLHGMFFFDETEWRRIDEYTAWLQERIVTVVGEALARRTPSTLQWGTGRADIAVNRRSNKHEEVSLLRARGQLKGPNDFSVPVLKVTSAEERLMAVVFGYACHPTKLTDCYRWCGDYVGFAQLDLEKAHPGAIALFCQGCGGDQVPWPRAGGDVRQTAAVGRQLAQAVEAVLAGAMTPVQGHLVTRYAEVELKLAKLPERKELQALAAGKNPYEARRAKQTLELLEAGKPPASVYPYPVQVWQIGSELRFIALGGEVVVDYALRLKEELGARRTWVAGYTNDVMAYIPSRRVLLEGGYEGGRGMVYYGLPTVWSPEVEETIVRQVHAQVGE